MEKISIIGIGKLGICLALNLEKNGYYVLGVDKNESYVKSINEKTFFSNEKGVNNLLKESKNLVATTSIVDAVNFSDILFVMVATPSLENGKYDHSQVESLVNDLKKIGKQKNRKLFIVGCTTYPGYCESLRKELEPLNYEILYNPEFIAQGDILNGQTNPDLVLIGETSEYGGNIVENIHKKISNNNPFISRISLTEAELAKLAMNCFITTKISFANMIGDLCNNLDISHENVLTAVGASKRIGWDALKWGFGFGGPCFPRDNRALGILCEENNIEPLIPKASDEYNKLHLDYQISDFINKNDKKEIIIRGVTYKEGSFLIEESQQLNFAVGLTKNGYEVTIIDDEFVLNEVRKIYGEIFKYEKRNY